jgi:hypothetical protein
MAKALRVVLVIIFCPLIVTVIAKGFFRVREKAPSTSYAGANWAR